MTSVKFRDHLCVDNDPANTLEAIIKMLASYGGTQSFSFDSEVDEDGSGVGNWNAAGSTLTLASAAGVLEGTGGGGATWDYSFYDGDTPDTFVVSLDVVSSPTGGVFFRATDVDNYYAVCWSATHVWIGKAVAGTGAYLCRLPDTIMSSGNAELIISVREEKYNHFDDTPEWLFITAWIDGHLIMTAADDISTGRPDNKFGLCAYDSDTVGYDNIRIPELTPIIPLASLDPGEPPMGGIMRAINTRNVMMWSRFDGALRVIRPKARAADWTTDADRAQSKSARVDKRVIVTHLRLVGAWEELDFFASAAKIKAWGHRFEKRQNPELMTKAEISTEGTDLMIRLEEMAQPGQASLPAMYLLEPEDRVTIDSTDWIVTGIEYKLSSTDPAQVLVLRKYCR